MGQIVNEEKEHVFCVVESKSVYDKVYYSIPNETWDTIPEEDQKILQPYEYIPSNPIETPYYEGALEGESDDDAMARLDHMEDIIHTYGEERFREAILSSEEVDSFPDNQTIECGYVTSKYAK